MPKKLPGRPNLEYLRTQSKTLLAKLREGDAASAELFSRHHPEAAGLTPEQVRQRGFRLADAQAVIARESGFAAWPSLARHVDRLRRMEGTWAFQSLELDGEAVPASMLSASRLLIDGDRFRTESPEGVYEGVFNIDVEAAPQRIDIDFHEGPEAGNRCEGLFELDGDRLRLCLGLAGSERPSAFATSPGSGHALEDLLRVEHVRPPGVDGGALPVAVPPPAPASPGDADAFDGTVTPALEKLQGEWTPVELITSGSALQSSYLAYGARVHAGAETKVVFGGQTMLHAKMRVYETPGESLAIDYLHLAGRAKGSISLGLLRWEGDHCVFCVAEPGAPRPTDFTCEPRSGRTLSRWKRK